MGKISKYHEGRSYYKGIPIIPASYVDGSEKELDEFMLGYRAVSFDLDLTDPDGNIHRVTLKKPYNANIKKFNSLRLYGLVPNQYVLGLITNSAYHTGMWSWSTVYSSRLYTEFDVRISELKPITMGMGVRIADVFTAWCVHESKLHGSNPPVEDGWVRGCLIINPPEYFRHDWKSSVVLMTYCPPGDPYCPLGPIFRFEVGSDSLLDTVHLCAVAMASDAKPLEIRDGEGELIIFTRRRALDVKYRPVRVDEVRNSVTMEIVVNPGDSEDITLELATEGSLAAHSINVVRQWLQSAENEGSETEMGKEANDG